MKIFANAPEFFINHEISPNILEAMIFKPVERMGNLNQNMFNDDFHNMFFGSSLRNTNIFQISSSDQGLQEKLIGAFASRHRYSDGHSVIEEVVEEVVESLIDYGQAAYFLQKSEGDKQFFRSIPANSVFRFLGLTFQYLPRRTQRNWSDEGQFLRREIRILERKRMLIFNWKKSVWKKVKFQNRVLKTLDRYAYEGGVKHMPRPTHENPNPKNYFDFHVWKKVQDEALFTATKLTGWSGRVTSHSDCSDFFICHRLLRFRKLQIELATHVLESLSSQLTTVGKCENNEFELNITFSEEYLNVLKLDELERRLESEDVSFGEVLDYCFQS